MLRSIITGSSRSIIQQSPRTILRRNFMKPSYAALNKKPDRVESELTHPALLKDPPIANPSSETDPWSLTPPSLPPVPEGLESMTIEEIIASPHPEGRDNELTEVLRKRLIYESRKRGILETDLILATFAKERIGTMVDRELREYDRFLTLPDWSIYYYTTNKAEAPEPWKSSWILGQLIEHAKNTGGQVRRMPDLKVGKGGEIIEG